MTEEIKALRQEVEDLRRAPNGAWRAHLGHLEQDNSLLQQEVEALKAERDAYKRNADAFGNTIRLLANENLTINLPRLEALEQENVALRAALADASTVLGQASLALGGLTPVEWDKPSSVVVARAHNRAEAALAASSGAQEVMG